MYIRKELSDTKVVADSAVSDTEVEYSLPSATGYIQVEYLYTEDEMFNCKSALRLISAVVMVSGLFGGMRLNADEPEAKTGGFRLDFVAYAGIGAGVSGAAGEIVPRLDLNSGIQFTPWLGIGAFYSISPLSDFAHADFGISVANVPNAFNASSGMEILMMPWPKSVIHPLFKFSIGGTTVGYGIDLDGEEHTFEQIMQERYFSASAAGGLEFSLGKHFRLSGTAGWRFIGNCEYLGIGAGHLSGFEVSISSRLVWRTVID